MNFLDQAQKIEFSSTPAVFCDFDSVCVTEGIFNKLFTEISVMIEGQVYKAQRIIEAVDYCHPIVDQ